MTDYILLAVGLILILGTGVFVASEFALVNLDRADLEARQAAGETRLSLTIKALKTTSTQLSSAQLGITLTTLLTGYTMEPAFSRLLGPVFSSWGIAEAIIRPLSAVIAMTIATILSMILGELVPKNFALAIPRQTAKLVVPLQLAFTAVFKPAIVLLNGSANAVLRAMGVEPKEELSGARSAEELSSLVRRSASAGVLEQDTATLLDRTLTFAKLSAADVMTPRPSVAVATASDNINELIQLARKTGHSRFPVIGDSVDDIVGVAHLKAAVAVPDYKRDEIPVAAIASPPLRVPETVTLDVLVTELRSRGYQMAIVMDEYGGTAGILTLEDLVEEIVGEVRDEHDRRQARIVRNADSVVIPGELRPDEVFQQAGIRVPEGDSYDTLGGFIMSELERIPSVGDEVEIEDGTLQVANIESRRITRVKFTPKQILSEEGGQR